MNNVKCVIGANFGDEGKGLMTDYFASQAKENEKTIVVLHNGGAQRGHTVETPGGIRYVFHHLGAGTFVRAHTYFADSFIVNPVIFRREYEELHKMGVYSCVYMHKNCKFTTIYDMLINQVIEIDRGTAKHGSCGMGVFETIYRNRKGFKFAKEATIKPLDMTVWEFHNLSYMDKIDFLTTVKDYYVEQRISELKLKKENPLVQTVLNSEVAIGNFIDDFKFLIEHTIFTEGDFLACYDNVIFEGGQGLLLDQHNMDYFPHLTPSNTGMENPHKILTELNYKGFVEACYVSRSYLTRHGAGRFDEECAKAEINKDMVDFTNVPNPFQDTLRYGKLNAKELSNRCYKDAHQYKDNLLLEVSIAITHINECYNYTIPEEIMYFSDGKTRNDVHKITNSTPLIFF